MEQLRSKYGGERTTLRPLFLSLILPALAVPAMAQDAKQDVEKLAAAYQQCVNKHGPAWVAALYSKDGVQVNPGGVFPDIKTVYEQNFKNGEDRIEIKVGHISPLSNDLVLADGETDIFFKNDKGETNKVTVFWTGVDIRENGQLKIRMLTAAPKPEPTKEASADKK
jgi:ketosteroid isomerase-like protein